MSCLETAVPQGLSFMFLCTKLVAFVLDWEPPKQGLFGHPQVVGGTTQKHPPQYLTLNYQINELALTSKSLL